MSSELGMVFEGCACRAAFHAGAAQWLGARGVKASAAAGSSSGAVIATGLAIGAHADLPDWWIELAGTPVLQPLRLLRGRWPVAMRAVTRRLYRRHLGDRSMREASIPLRVVVSHLGPLGLSERVIDERSPVSMVKALMGSTFIPGAYVRPRRVDGRVAFDGAWTSKVPVHALPDSCDKAIVFVSNVRGHALPSELRRTPMTLDPRRFRVLSPLTPLPVGHFDFDRERTLASFEVGRQSAARFARTNEVWLSA